jgi:nucleoside-diphosphate-sugar epimerase/predicted dehydrogenase
MQVRRARSAECKIRAHCGATAATLAKMKVRAGHNGPPGHAPTTRSSHRTLRAALIGCGKIAQMHAIALERAGVPLVAACDLDVQKANEIAARSPGTVAFTDADALLAESHPDVVHVTTPPSSHAELAAKVVEAGAHVLVEKPVALSTAAIDTVIEAAERNGVRVVPNHNYLSKPSVQRAIDIVRSGEIGEVVHVEVYYGLSEAVGNHAGVAPGHWANRLPGGVFTNYLPHVIYLQSAFLGGIGSVAGVATARAGGAGDATELTVLVESAAATGTMSISLRGQPYAKYVRVFGTRGIVHADMVGEVTTINRQWRLPRLLAKAIFNLEVVPQLTIGTAVNTAKVLTGAMRNMPDLHTFVDALYTALEVGEEPPAGEQEAREVVAVMEEIWDRLGESAPSRLVRAFASTHHEARSEIERQIVADDAIPGRVLVTGGTGYLGRHLVASLVRCGVEVRSLVRDPSRIPDELAEQAHFVLGNVVDRESLDTAMRDVDYVVHCAAVTTNSVPWHVHEETNVNGTRAVLDAAQQAQVKRLVHVSSVAVYGMGKPRRNAFAESAPPPADIDPWAYYLRSKLAAEELVLAGAERTNDVVVRPGIIYGPGRPPKPGVVQLGVAQVFLGLGRNHLPYTYVDNVVDGILLALRSSQAAGRVYNLVDQPAVRARDVAISYANARGESVRVLSVPVAPVGLLAAVLEHRRARVRASVPPRLSRANIASMTRDIRYDVSRARRELGWTSQVTLQEGLRRTSAIEL